MDNKFEAVMDFISQSGHAGKDTYLNYVTNETNDDNTAVLTSGAGKVITSYVDGACLINLPFEIRQIKPHSKDSNVYSNSDAMAEVQRFMDWINEQGKTKNFPDFGERCTIQSMATPKTAKTPNLIGLTEAEDAAIYVFPIEIIFLERK